jgi:hypothetical protein
LSHDTILFALVIFLVEFHMFAWAGLDCYHPIYIFLVARIIDTCHSTHLIETGSHKLFAWAGLEPLSS